MIELQEVHFSYRRHRVLRGVSAVFAPGRLYGVFGPNGSGKSTLLKMITGELRPSAGRVRPEYASPLERARRLAVVDQSTPATLPLTVQEVVALGRYPWKRDSANADVVAHVLAKLRLEELSATHYSRLSGGEQQRVMLARALAQETATLLLDEPASSLDLRHQRVFYAILRQLADHGRCVIMVSHDLFLAPRFLDAALLMHAGEIIASGAPADVLTQGNLARVFAGGETPPPSLPAAGIPEPAAEAIFAGRRADVWRG